VPIVLEISQNGSLSIGQRPLKESKPLFALIPRDLPKWKSLNKETQKEVNKLLKENPKNQIVFHPTFSFVISRDPSFEVSQIKRT